MLALATAEGPVIAAISKYWESQSPRLRADFDRIRAAHSDSDVKGTANEQILSEFLQQNLAASTMSVGSSIIDSDGHQSDEVDIAVCNEYQPFRTTGAGELLIAEGVDAVYQVKARLDSAELRRAVDNCRSVKQLKRRAANGDMVRTNPADTNRFVDRVPYFVFGFVTHVSVETAYETLVSACEGLDYDQQPDGVFTLDDWCLINVGTNEGALKIVPLETRGFARSSGAPGSLASMLWCHYACTPRIQRFTNPLVAYSPWTRTAEELGDVLTWNDKFPSASS